MPDLVDIGWALIRDGDYTSAIERFRLAIAVDNNNARAHFALAEALLAQGEDLAGWREFRWRRVHNGTTAGIVAKMQAPEWNGMKLHKGRLLIICDEGLGDAIMFARYIPLVAKYCAELVIGWGRDHQDIFSHIQGTSRICGDSSELPHYYDAWALICDMPNIFASTAETIPREPYLHADPTKSSVWKTYFEKTLPSSHARVGLVWSGSATYSQDTERSLQLEQLLPILELEDIAFVSLQKEVRPVDQPLLATLNNVYNLSNRLTNFSETIAAISRLDLVITVDTSVAHLAGAMGIPTWILTRRPSEWRWGLEGDATPWYESVRLFRQEEPSQWAAPIKRMAEELRSGSLSKGLNPPIGA